jgi:hypothetical protein
MIIGVISDTHVPDRQGKVPEAVIRGLQGVDMIIHAGDLTGISVLRELEKIAPVHAVSGNMDSWEVKSALKPVLQLKILDKNIVVFHGVAAHSATEEAARTRYPGADCVVFGHTHRPYNDREGGTLVFNPGTASRVFGLGPSYGILTVREGRPIEGEVIEA